MPSEIAEWISAIATAIAALLAGYSAHQSRSAAKESKDSAKNAADAAQRLANASEGIAQMQVLQTHSCLTSADLHAVTKSDTTVDVRIRVTNIGGAPARVNHALVDFGHGRHQRMVSMTPVAVLGIDDELPTKKSAANPRFLKHISIDGGQTKNLLIRCERKFPIEEPLLVQLEPQNGPPLSVLLERGDSGEWKDVSNEPSDPVIRLRQWLNREA